MTVGDPYKFFGGVVENKTDTVGGTGINRACLSLDGFDEVFMGVLGKVFTFFSIKEDVIGPEGNVG